MSTKLIQVVEWARPFISNLFVFVDSAIGSTLEPALTNANLVLGTMLGPPFVWEWNRTTANFTMNPSQSVPTDYPVAIANFGFNESGRIAVPTGAPADAGTIYQLQPNKLIEVNSTSQKGRPNIFCVYLDDQAGNITFRVGPVAPDLAYVATVTFQKAPVFLTSSKTVIEIPDKLMHVFKWGFLAMAFLYDQDSRFAGLNQKFISTLLGAQSGLDDAQRNIFLTNWYSQIYDMQAMGLKIQQGHQARNV
jgi:hypothetical protein